MSDVRKDQWARWGIGILITLLLGFNGWQLTKAESDTTTKLKVEYLTAEVNEIKADLKENNIAVMKDNISDVLKSTEEINKKFETLNKLLLEFFANHQN